MTRIALAITVLALAAYVAIVVFANLGVDTVIPSIGTTAAGPL